MVLGFAAFAFEPTTFVPFQEQRELEWNAWQALLGNAYLWWTILALVVMVIRLAPYRSNSGTNRVRRNAASAEVNE